MLLADISRMVYQNLQISRMEICDGRQRQRDDARAHGHHLSNSCTASAAGGVDQVQDQDQVQLVVLTKKLRNRFKEGLVKGSGASLRSC